jgi:hypothetical protein
MTDIYYAEYKDIDPSKILKIYVIVLTINALSKRCQDILQEYNQKSTSDGKKLDLVFFNDHVGDFARISKIFVRP